MGFAEKKGMILVTAPNFLLVFYQVGLKFNMQGKEKVGIVLAKTRKGKVDGLYIGEFIVDLYERHAQKKDVETQQRTERISLS